MVQVNFALKEQFSWQDYCASFAPTSADGWEKLPESSRLFLELLNLSTVHPHCVSQSFETDAPLMGPLLQHDYHESVWDALITTWKQASPTLFAMGELWLRLFAALLAPLGVAYLVWTFVAHSHDAKPVKAEQSQKFRITLASMLSLASSAVLATDMWYVYQYGPHYGISLLVASSLLTSIIATRHRLVSVGIILVFVWTLTIKLSFKNGTFQFGGDELPHNVPEGLYYNHLNPLVHKLVQNWPVENRTYTVETGATSWTVTGDTRTGIPFLVNDAFPWPDLELTKVWVPTVDDEAVRLELAFPPKGGHRLDKAVYVVLHGLSGGSQEEFIKDHVHRATARGHTVVIMIARGLMDTPIKGWNVFHGARIADIEATVQTIRIAIYPGQSLVGVGYSMGAIILANYVARTGADCALDAAIAVSGVLDSRFQLFNERAKRVWQPMLAITLRDQFVIGKVGERYRARLSRTQMLGLMRATHISSVDQHGVVTYNGFDDLMHYYSEMSAMGDIPLDSPTSPGRIANVSIPLCILHALDDPLITWKAVAANEGLRHPSNVVKSGSGNVLMLLTKAGGHVGWPLGANPAVKKWGWMNGAVQSYTEAFEAARKDKS